MPTSNATLDQSPTLDHSEVERFSRIAAEWWDPNGKFRPLHKLGPARMGYMRDTIINGLKLTPPVGALRVLDGLKILDIGCGGGLVAEPLARLGAHVTGIDPSLETIAAASTHAAAQDLSIDYRAIRAEDIAATGKTYDVVTCLEVVEHVPDVRAFLAVAASLVRPGGLLVLSTLNRTLKSYALAIIGAEYVLRWVPVGTHQWQRFITPDELEKIVTGIGLIAESPRGLVFNPLADTWSLSGDTDVNYFLSARKPH